MTPIARTLPLLLAAGLSLSGCKLLKSRQDAKACARMAELFGTPGKSSTTSGCVAELDEMKKEDPKKYECTTKCLTESRRSEEASACLVGCEHAAAAKNAGRDNDVTEETYPVDSLTPSTVKTQVASKYQYFGYEIIGEQTNAAGWSSTVVLGKKAPYEEVHIYKVLLVDVRGRDDGFAVVSSFAKKDVAVESRVGRKRALYVECLYQRNSTEGGAPRACSASDSRIKSFTDDLATVR